MTLDNDGTDRPGLATTLRSHHAGMIAFGGTIGAGIFTSSGAGIASAGPAIVVSYLVVGVLVAIAMRTLSILTVHSPDSGSFATHAGTAFWSPGRFAVGWMYWWLMVVTASVECTAAGSTAHSLLGILPAPIRSILFITVLTAVNLAPVHVFGEFQYWLVLTKIILVLSVPLIALIGALDLIPGASTAGATGTLSATGLVPNGFGPVVGAMLVAAFSFVGIELTAIAAGETDLPRRVIPATIHVVMYTVLCSYVFALSMRILIVPWNESKAAVGPFNAMMAALHIPASTKIINFVVLAAVLSVSNSCIYAASRIGYALAGQRDAPQPWRRLSHSRVPAVAVISSGFVGAMITIVTDTAPNNISKAVVDSCGAAGMMTWIAIVLTYLKLRTRPESRMAAANATSRRTIAAAGLAAIALVALLVGMFFLRTTQFQIIMTLLTTLVIFGIVVWRETNRAPSNRNVPCPTRDSACELRFCGQFRRFDRIR